MHACLLSQPPHPTPKTEVQLVDHLNNALNNSTVIAAKTATIGLELDQQLVRRNSKFSICAAENAASICMTNGTFVQGCEGRPRLQGDTSWEGRCHTATGQPSTLQHSAQHSAQWWGQKLSWPRRAALEKETQDLTCICAKWYENRRKPAAGWSDFAQSGMILFKHKDVMLILALQICTHFLQVIHTTFVLYNLRRAASNS